MSCENAEPLDQILASLRAKEMLHVCRDTLEVKLSFGDRYLEARLGPQRKVSRQENRLPESEQKFPRAEGQGRGCN